MHARKLELMNNKKISKSLRECVLKDDVIGARSLLVGVGEQDRKSVVAKTEDRNAPLFVAAMRGNVDMVEFLVEDYHADTEELGYYIVNESWHLVTPLLCAAALKKLEVVKLLIKLEADINAVSETGDMPMLYACAMNKDVFECYVKHGADFRNQTTTVRLVS